MEAIRDARCEVRADEKENRPEHLAVLSGGRERPQSKEPARLFDDASLEAALIMLAACKVVLTVR